MYRLGNIHIRLEHVTMVFPVHPLLGHDGVHGFDVMVGGHVHTAKYLDVDHARRAHAALLAALEPAPAVAAEPEPAASPTRAATKPAARRKGGKSETARSRH